ncbi:antibiotic biosynthesis monooxygenase family protein [Streptomyces sediminimaris]|uniref:antibiotic biosynthesis monooxygenase family protein n=1 Tax=Streptomyces sediminimaris TaxID=3383721 RepID=UPI00399AB54A
MNRIQVPAAAEGFEEQFAESMRRHLDGTDGLVGARLLRPQQADGAYVAVMDFVSRDAFTAWMRSPSFRAAHQTSAPGMTGDVESYETVVAVGA